MSKFHISAIEVLEAVLQLKAGRYDLDDFSVQYLDPFEIQLSENEVIEEIRDLFLPIFRSKNSFETALFVMSTSYKAESVGFLADRYLEIFRGAEICS